MILVDLAHSGSSNPDHSWMRITLEGKEPISQMGVPPTDNASAGAAPAPTSSGLGHSRIPAVSGTAGSGQRYIVNGEGKQQSFVCNGDDVSISGFNNEVDISGKCEDLTISGTGHKVTAEEVSAISISGSGTVINYVRGPNGRPPTIRGSSRLNTVKQVPAGTRSTSTLRSNSVDLLALTDPRVHGEGNHWRETGDGIEANNLTGSSFLTIPYQPPPEYNLHVIMTKKREKANEGNDTHIFIPWQSKYVPFIVRHHGDRTILSFFSAEENRDLTGRSPRGVTLDKGESFATRRKLTFEVRRSGIRVLLDARPLFTLDNNVSVRTSDKGLRLGSWQNQTLFHSVVVEPVG